MEDMVCLIPSEPVNIVQYSSYSQQQNGSNLNPVLYAPDDVVEITFWETKATMDVETYKKFLTNVVSRFRKSVTYKSYKSYLYDIGLDRCQVLGITTEMADLEMHHNFLTIYDIAYMITEHILNTLGYVSTFMVVQELKRVHTENKVPIVMISKTVHQLYHANKEFVIPGKMCFGMWTELIKEFNMGLSLDISYKILNFIDESLHYEETSYKELPDHELLELRDQLKEWNKYNEYITNYPTNEFINIMDNNLRNRNNYYLDSYYTTYQIESQRY